MKSPPVQYRDDVARQMVEAFIATEEPGAAHANGTARRATLAASGPR
jgi:hypothetical protein